MNDEIPIINFTQALEMELACERIMSRFPRFKARPAPSPLPNDNRLGIALDVGGGDTWWSSEKAAMRYAESGFF
jgi:hypothetical protein